jgi:hypothetical protein
MKSIQIPLFAFVVVAAISCSILKQEDPETKVRNFVAAFEQALSASDNDILAMFDTQQSQEAIMSAIRLLQNQTEYGIRCLIYPADAIVTFEEAGIRVVISADFSGMIDENNLSNSVTTFTLILTPKKGSFVITKLEGEDFYSTYTQMKYDLAEAQSQQDVLGHIVEYTGYVKLLQQTYDTVAWAAQYENTPYFYAVKGEWTEAHDGNFVMGLVDKTGKEIVPIKYNMVGTIGFDWPGLLEVRRGNAVGLYSVTDGEVVPAEFDWIIPFETTTSFAIVKSGDITGWLDKTFKYHEGFPSEAAKTFISNHDFLPTGREFSNATVTLCEIPSEENYGAGILIFPSYLTETGLFHEVASGFSMYAETWRGNTEAIAADHKFFDSVLDGVNMLMTSITTRYLDGRQAFYTTDEVSFVDNSGSLIGTSATLSSSDFTINRIDSTLIEIVAAYVSEEYEYYDETTDESENNLPQYLYFHLEENGPVQLTSNRTFNYTEFVKLDSSYLEGNFTYFSHETLSEQTRTFLSDSSLMRMRNEILAEYGYIFPDDRTTEHFKYFSWYLPRFGSLAAFESALTDIDRHNLKFLEKILGPLPEKDENI